MHISICDDDITQVRHLRNLAKKWASERNIALLISDFFSAESFLFAYADDKTADILLLDIQMAEMDGVAMAKEIRKSNRAVQIIFITGYMDYILDGYDVEALHYLLKPVDNTKLFAALDKAAEKLAYADRAIFIPHAAEFLRLPLAAITHIEVMHNHTTIHANQSYTIKKPLRELEKSLDSSFFRCGRSFIVNLRHIQRVTKGEIHLKNGNIIPLARGFYTDLNRAIIDRL